jgi:hypothetical protein
VLVCTQRYSSSSSNSGECRRRSRRRRERKRERAVASGGNDNLEILGVILAFIKKKFWIYLVKYINRFSFPL